MEGGGACAKGRVWEGRTGTKAAALMGPGTRSEKATRTAAMVAVAGAVNWMQQRWTKQWMAPGRFPGALECWCDAPCSWTTWVAGVSAAPAHPGMDPHVNALSAKDAVTTAEIEARTSGFSIPSLVKGDSMLARAFAPARRAQCSLRGLAAFLASQIFRSSNFGRGGNLDEGLGRGPQKVQQVVADRNEHIEALDAGGRLRSEDCAAAVPEEAKAMVRSAELSARGTAMQ